MTLKDIQKAYNKSRINAEAEIDKIINANERLLNRFKFHNLFKEFRGINKQIRDNNLDNIIYQNRTLTEIYNLYVQKYTIKFPPKKRRNPIYQIENIDYENPFPFKTKIKYFKNDVNINNIPLGRGTIPDYQLKPLQKLQRPYFSPKLGSWEVDIVYAPHPTFKNQATYYLFCININTKYLVVIRTQN
jgi:hypothetical protein